MRTVIFLCVVLGLAAPALAQSPPHDADKAAPEAPLAGRPELSTFEKRRPQPALCASE